jgi:hypothetical protein
MAPHLAAIGELTPAQQSIVEWDDGPLVVIAGAGTGKTRVIVDATGSDCSPLSIGT